MAKIQPGLERIAQLLKNIDFPWSAIHVAGTNGKGSICHHAASVLTGRDIRVGKFTSPHLIDRWDCISINGAPVRESKFRRVEHHFQNVNIRDHINASPFEILTATAFTIFNDEKVKVGVVEVGLGGKLDATNILNNQAVSVISKIARDHEDFLGNTLSEITAHKAGILRPNVPYLITSANEQDVINDIDAYASEIKAGPRLTTESFDLGVKLYDRSKWARIIPNMVPFQQENIKMAVVAAMQTLNKIDLPAKPLDIAKTLLFNLSAHHHGRQERIQVPPVFRNSADLKNLILVDGAHNPDAATALDQVVTNRLRFGNSPKRDQPQAGWPVTWVLAMTDGKDARKYLATLLKPGDKVVTTTFGPVDGMPWVKPMDPKLLLQIAKEVEPKIIGVHVPILGALRAVSTAKYLSPPLARWAPIVLTGSLYLVGDFHRELRPRSSKAWWTDTDDATVADRASMLKIQAEERERATAALPVPGNPHRIETEQTTQLQDEIDALNREVVNLEIEEERFVKARLAALDVSEMLPDDESLSAVERFERDERIFTEMHSTPEQIAEQLARAEKQAADLVAVERKLKAEAEARAAKLQKRAAKKELLEQRRIRKMNERERERREQEAARNMEKERRAAQRLLRQQELEESQRQERFAREKELDKYSAILGRTPTEWLSRQHIESNPAPNMQQPLHVYQKTFRPGHRMNQKIFRGPEQTKRTADEVLNLEGGLPSSLRTASNMFFSSSSPGETQATSDTDSSSSPSNSSNSSDAEAKRRK